MCGERGRRAGEPKRLTVGVPERRRRRSSCLVCGTGVFRVFYRVSETPGRRVYTSKTRPLSVGHGGLVFTGILLEPGKDFSEVGTTCRRVKGRRVSVSSTGTGTPST